MRGMSTDKPPTAIPPAILIPVTPEELEQRIKAKRDRDAEQVKHAPDVRTSLNVFEPSPRVLEFIRLVTSRSMVRVEAGNAMVTVTWHETKTGFNRWEATFWELDNFPLSPAELVDSLEQMRAKSSLAAGILDVKKREAGK